MTQDKNISILQVSTSDKSGGAEKIAWNLFQEYRDRGFCSWLAVGDKKSDDPNVLLLPNIDSYNRWTRTWLATSNILSPFVETVHGAWRLQNWLRWWVGQPIRSFRIRRGYEDFDFPGTKRVLELPSVRPSILHCHNLHGNYFDLRALSWLSRQVPTVLTLHDAWLLSGHCAHSFDCKQWKNGCERCPDLTIYPAIKNDASAYNWQRKLNIYKNSRFYVATPCQWLMDKVQQSMLMEGAVECRVIPNGINLSIFHPDDRKIARARLGLPQEARILFFAANGIRRNIWKDYVTLQKAVAIVAEKFSENKVLFIAVGEEAPPEYIGKAEIHFVPYQEDERVVACYYQAADIYIHAAKADTFPNTVLEALACGTPVVGTSVGGIPEQVINGVTGFLTPPGDAEAMSVSIERLLSNSDLLYRYSIAAAKMAHNFALNFQVENYLNWYNEILSKHDNTSNK